MKADYVGKRFSFPGPTISQSPWDPLRWMLTRKMALWPRHIDNPLADEIVERVEGDALSVTLINDAMPIVAPLKNAELINSFSGSGGESGHGQALDPE